MRRLLTAALVAGATVAGGVVGARLSRARPAPDTATRDDASRDRTAPIAVTASHDLRTPITALRLSLEDLTLWDTTPPDVAAEIRRSIAELDRLSHAVTDVLGTQVSDGASETVDVAEVVADVVALWPAPGGAGIELGELGPVHGRGSKNQLEQVLKAMLRHATGRSSTPVAVDVAETGPAVRVRVSYARPRLVPTGVIHGTTPAHDTDGDAGLAEAGAVAEAMNGYLAVEDSPAASLVLLIPAAALAS